MLDELLGAEVFVKHENHLPTGAFKVRGGINLVSQLDAEERERGVIAASTGNHGQSIAYAARLFGVRATICVPEEANPVKVASMRGLGAELVFHGRDYDEAREHCERLAAEHGYRYVHSGNEPLLIAGVATHTLEILEEQPETDVVIVPIGGGSGAAGVVRRREGGRPVGQGHRRPVGGRAGRVPLLARAAARRGPDGDVRRRPRHAHGVRATADDPLGVAGRVRARERRRDPRGAGADDRDRRATSSRRRARRRWRRP